jgi:TRAP-type mannitol/chloroaromatic compound transport system permease small subunit
MTITPADLAGVIVVRIPTHKPQWDFLILEVGNGEVSTHHRRCQCVDRKDGEFSGGGAGCGHRLRCHRPIPFGNTNQWAYDSTYMLYGSYTILGAAYCHREQGHVRMDLFYGKLSQRGKAITDVICYLLLFFPLFTVLLYKCGENAYWSLLHGERSSASVWRPYMAPFKMSIVLGIFLFYLQGIAEFIRALTTAIKGERHDT